MSINTPSELQQLAKDLASNKDFRAKLKQSPKEAIAERLATKDFTWPEDLQIKVVENDKNTINLVLPAMDKDGKLTDDDLNSLAAGEVVIGAILAPGFAGAGAAIAAIATVGAFAGLSTLAVGAIAAGITIPILAAQGDL